MTEPGARPSGQLSRRAALATGAAAAAGLSTARHARAALANLEIIAPANAGGGYDQLARAVQEVLQAKGLAESVQVVNIPGAGGTIGLAQFVTRRRRAPGLLVAGLGMVGAIRINQSAVTLDQVTPLARMTGEYQPLVVAADSPLRTLGDLLARFKEDPGAVSWGGFALGSPDHIVCALVVKAAGGDVTRMNYIVSGAGGELLASVMGGHITVATGGLNEFSQQIATGELRALGLSSPERLPGVDMPTFKEQGVDVTLVNWRGLMAPGELRAADLEELDAALGEVAGSAEWRTIVGERGWVELYQPAEAFASFLAEERPRIESMLGELGLVQ